MKKTIDKYLSRESTIAPWKRSVTIGSLALLATGAGEFAVIGIEKVTHANHETDTYSKKGIANHLKENKISPTSVQIHSIQHGEKTPTQVAEDLHAKDVATVAGEISGQVGGQDHMREGMDIAIPLDQLNIPAADNNK